MSSAAFRLPLQPSMTDSKRFISYKSDPSLLASQRIS